MDKLKFIFNVILWILFLVGLVGVILGIAPLGYLIMPLVVVEACKAAHKNKGKK